MKGGPRSSMLLSATLAVLHSTCHGGAHPCLSNQGAGGGWVSLGVKPWDPSKLSSSVSLPNHMLGWDEETKHLFLLEHYLLAVSLPVPAHMKMAIKDLLCFCCIPISAINSCVAEKMKPLLTYSTAGLTLAMYACSHTFSCLLPRHFHVCCLELLLTSSQGTH